jgi:hypothetical protein
MQSPKPCFTISLFALILLATNAARADEITFSWQSTITPSSIPADQVAGLHLGLVGLGGASKYNPNPTWIDYHAVGATYLTARDLTATFSAAPFTLTLKLTDGPSGLSDVLTFHGIVYGAPSASLPSLFTMVTAPSVSARTTTTFKGSVIGRYSASSRTRTQTFSSKSM